MNEVNVTDALLESIESATDSPIGEVVVNETAILAVAETDPAITAKNEAYAEQESTVGVASMENVVATATTTAEAGKGTKKARKGAKVKATGSTPAVGVKRVSTADLTASEAIVHKIGNDPKHFAFNAAHAALDEAGLVQVRDNFLTASNTLAKKVKEKTVNLLDAVVNGKDLSVYTEIALRELISKGRLTSAELKAAYQSGSDPYSEGTAASQAGQMFQLLPAVGIASSGGKGILELVGDSTLAQAFKAKMTA